MLVLVLVLVLVHVVEGGVVISHYSLRLVSNTIISTLHEYNPLLSGVTLSEDCATVHRDANEVAASHRRRYLTAVTEHDDASIAGVSDDELVKGRGHHTLGTLEPRPRGE